MTPLVVVLLGMAATAEGRSADDGVARRHALGQVTDSSGMPLAGIEVQLIGCDAQFRCGDIGNPVFSDATGHYDVSSTVASALVFVAFRDEPVEQGAVGEYWDDVQLLNDARNVSFGDDGVATGIDAVLEPASYLTGRVTDETGEPLEGVAVTQWIRGSSFYTPRTSTTTSADGTYRLRTTKGEHLIELDGDDDLTRDAWAGGATQEEADPVLLEAGSTAAVGDSVLQRVGHITGTLREDGPSGRVAGCLVYSYRLGASGWTLDARASPDDAGRYSLPVLPGIHVLRFCDDTGPYRQWYAEWWKDAAVPARATRITVRAAETTAGHRAKVARRGLIAGKVTVDRGVDYFSPFPVLLLARRGGQVVEVARTYTDRLGDNYGRWQFFGLEPGAYTVRYQPPAYLKPATSSVELRRSGTMTDVNRVLVRRRWRPADQPVVTGKAVVGSTLEVSAGTWQTHDGIEATPPMRYQWLAGDRPISGATASSYTVTPQVQGQQLRVLVTAVGDPTRYLSKTVTTAPTRRIPRLSARP